MKRYLQDKFIIVTVNYKTWYLIKYQLKIYYEFNYAKDFYFIIIDNSCDKEERDNLEKTIEQYKLFNNIEIIYNKPLITEDNEYKVNLGSSQHAQGLNIGLKRSYEMYDEDHYFKYCIMQDPDWFWAISNHLNYLRKIIEKEKFCAIGGPYNFIDQYFIFKSKLTGHFNFPALFGCVFDLSIMNRNISLMPGEEGTNLGVVEGRDVGWRKRKYFSDKNYSYLPLLQNPRSKLRKIIGETKTEDLMFEYCKSIFNRKIIAYHLLRGSQVNEDFYRNFTSNFLDKNEKVNKTWLENKLAFAIFIYESIKNKRCRYMKISRVFIAMLFLTRIGIRMFPFLRRFLKKYTF